MKNLFIGLACITSFIFTACEKDEVLSQADKLTSKKWDLSASMSMVMKNGVIVSSFDSYQEMLECEQATKWNFKTNNTLIVEDKCVPDGDPEQFIVQNWSFSGNEWEILIDNEIAYISRLSENELILTIELPNEAGTERRSLTFVH